MFVVHIFAGMISGITVAALIQVTGYPLWISILGYSVGGACGTLLSALTWFLLAALAENSAAECAPGHLDFTAAEA